jgi:hypothetical protein
MRSTTQVNKHKSGRRTILEEQSGLKPQNVIAAGSLGQILIKQPGLLRPQHIIAVGSQTIAAGCQRIADGSQTWPRAEQPEPDPERDLAHFHLCLQQLKSVLHYNRTSYDNLAHVCKAPCTSKIK